MERAFLYFFATAILAMAFYAMRKDWHKTSLLFLVCAVILAITGQEWGRGFIKTQVLSMIINYGKKLEGFHETTSRIQNQLTETQDSIEAAQTRLETHQEKLENLGLLIKDIFKRIRTESFSNDTAKNIIIVSNGPTKGTIFVRLADEPIVETVTLFWFRVFFAPGDYTFHHNVIIMPFDQDVNFLKQHLKEYKLSVTYIADLTAKTLPLNLVKKGNQVFAGKELLYDGEQTLWPNDLSGPSGPKE